MRGESVVLHLVEINWRLSTLEVFDSELNKEQLY